MKRLIGLSILALALATTAACAPVTTTLAEFNARQEGRQMTSYGMQRNLAQPPVDYRPRTRGAIY